MPQPADPGPGEILVKLRSVGICGSDMHWYVDGNIYGFPASYPQVLGHEPAGEVVGIGSGVTELKCGDRVSIEPTVSCGHCEYCVRGQHNNCLKSQFMGSPQLPGLLREYATVPAHNASIIPEAFIYTQAPLIQPVALFIHMLDVVEIPPRDMGAGLGAGPPGVVAPRVWRRAGAFYGLG